MTCSIGFRAPAAGELVRELLLRLADEAGDGDDAGPLYRDPGQPAVARPAALPQELLVFAQQALQQHLDDPQALQRVLGAWLTEPKPRVWFEGRDGGPGAVHLDAATRMLYDGRHVFINGEAFATAGRDARLVCELADKRRLPGAQRQRLSPGAQALFDDWLAAGWLHVEGAP